MSIQQRKTAFCCLSVLCIWILSSPALAHKIRIFAYADGEVIVGEAAFSGGRAVKNAEIIVQDALNSQVLLTRHTDAQGAFRFSIPDKARQARLNLRIIVNAGAGHRSDWLLKAGEYLEGGKDTLPADTRQQSPVSAEENRGANFSLEERKEEGELEEQEERIRRIVEEVMDKKLGPVKQMLAENASREPGLRDILGGIGYLLGLAGIIAYFKSKIVKKE